MTKLLWRTVNLNRQSYNCFQWNGLNEITTAPDWNPDPKIECGQGLHGIDGDDPNANAGLLDWCGSYYLQLVEVQEGDYVRSSDGRKYRFRAGKVVEEHRITPRSKNQAALFKRFQHGMLYWAGRYRHSITDEQCREAFNRFEGEWLYLAGRDWDGITDEQRREAFNWLEGEWLYLAGCYWHGITDEQRREAFNLRLEGEWLYRAGRDWHGITDEQRAKAKDGENETN